MKFTVTLCVRTTAVICRCLLKTEPHLDFLDEEVVLKDVPEPKPEDTSPVNPDLEIVKLENQRKIHEAKLRAELAEWQAVLDNVRAGKVTPVELRALELKAEQSDPQAVEILGWIYSDREWE